MSRILIREHYFVNRRYQIFYILLRTKFGKIIFHILVQYNILVVLVPFCLLMVNRTDFIDGFATSVRMARFTWTIAGYRKAALYATLRIVRVPGLATTIRTRSIRICYYIIGI